MENLNAFHIKTLKMNPNATIPTKAHETDAGFDLYACLEESVVILPYTNCLIPTGVAFEIPKNMFGAVYPRSGLSTKEGLRLSNCVGIIDSGYINQVYVSLYNDSGEVRKIKNNDRIAQIIFQTYINDIGLEEVDSLKDTDRGLGGFGSSGK